jgi:hypothetical protein
VLRNPEKGSYCMIEVAKASINSFASGKADFVQPSDQLITLTLGQLKDLIQEATERAIVPLVARLDALEDEVRRVGPRGGGEETTWPPQGERSLPGDQGSQISLSQVVQGLQAENQALKSELEALQESTARERAYDRQRIAKLEAPKITAKTKERAEKIKRYLESRPDHRTTLETLKGYLGIKNYLLDDAIHALQANYPNAFVVERAKAGDKRKKIIRMLPRY